MNKGSETMVKPLLRGIILATLTMNLLVNHEQAHEACRIKFLMEEIQVGEESFRVPKSTSRMKTDEFANYIFVIVDYLREYYNFVVPEPKEKI